MIRGSYRAWNICRRWSWEPLQTQAQNNSSTLRWCLCAGTMTTETTVSKGQEFFSGGQTEGGMKGKINWECCDATAAADTIETIGQCVPFWTKMLLSLTDSNTGWKMAEQMKKKGGGEGALQTKSTPVLILGHPSTFTFNWAGGRRGDGTVTDIPGWSLHFHKRVHILKSHRHDELWQLKATQLIWSNQEWRTTGYLWENCNNQEI